MSAASASALPTNELPAQVNILSVDKDVKYLFSLKLPG